MRSAFKYVDGGNFAWGLRAAVLVLAGSGGVPGSPGWQRRRPSPLWPPGGAVATRPPARLPARPRPAPPSEPRLPAVLRPRPPRAARQRCAVSAPHQPLTPVSAALAAVTAGSRPALRKVGRAEAYRPSRLSLLAREAALRAPLAATPLAHAFWFWVPMGHAALERGTQQIRVPSFVRSELATPPSSLQSPSFPSPFSLAMGSAEDSAFDSGSFLSGGDAHPVALERPSCRPLTLPLDTLTGTFDLMRPEVNSSPPRPNPSLLFLQWPFQPHHPKRGQNRRAEWQPAAR